MRTPRMRRGAPGAVLAAQQVIILKQTPSKPYLVCLQHVVLLL